MNKSTLIFEPFVKFIIEFYFELKEITALASEVNSLELFNNNEKALLHESFLVKVATNWEHFNTNLFAYCCTLGNSKLQQELGLELPAKIGFNNAYAIINGLNFLSVKNANDLIGKSRKYLIPENNPYIKVDKNIFNRIDELLILRNYVSHRSENSKKRLIKFYQGSPDVKYKNTGFISPGEYLMSTHKVNSIEFSNYSRLYSALLLITVEHWKFLDFKSFYYVWGEAEEYKKGISIIDKSNIKEYSKMIEKTFERMEEIFNHLNKKPSH